MTQLEQNRSKFNQDGDQSENTGLAFYSVKQNGAQDGDTFSFAGYEDKSLMGMTGQDFRIGQKTGDRSHISPRPVKLNQTLPIQQNESTLQNWDLLPKLIETSNVLTLSNVNNMMMAT